MTINVDQLKEYTIGIPHCYAHPNIPEEMLKILSKDDHTWVRNAASEHLIDRLSDCV